MAITERKPLGQMLRRAPRYGINAAAIPLRPGVATYIRITDIDESGRFAPNLKVGVAHPAVAKYQLSQGELVFARTGASVGKSYLYDPHDGELVFAGFLINIAPDPQRLNPKFLALYAQTKEYWDWVARTSVRSGQPGVNGREYATLPIPAPNIATQNAIANVVSDVDTLITTLEHLIAKKQAIKQGMMQQLLTGKTRLPGFNETWRERPFEDLAAPSRDRVSPKNVSIGTRLIELEHIGGGSGRLHGSSTAVNAVSLKTIFRPGDVLFGKLRAYLRKYWLADSDGLCSTEIWALRAKSDAVGAFVRYVVETDRFIEVASGGYGTHMPRSDWGVIRKLSIATPALDEQEAISQVLLDADTEINALCQKLEKANFVKQGMMQQLLTGRTRLPIEETTA